MSSSSKNYSSVIIWTSCTTIVGIVTVALAVRRWYKIKQQQEIDDDDDNDDDDHNDDDHQYPIQLPQHLQRMIYKEKRRKESVRFLAMKSPMYDNIKMYGPDGRTLLCTISSKKANWYIRKNLATWNNNNNEEDDKSSSSSIRLNFEPKQGRKSKIQPDVYTTSQKKNICVCCGDESGDYMRHYIVPYCYRTLLPSEYKSHMGHDIVILCPDCNLTCKQYTQKRQKSIENSLRTNPEITAISVISNPKLQKIKSKALALLNHRNQLPIERRIEYEQLLRTYNNLVSEKELTIDIIKQNSEMDTTIPNPNYISGPQLVIEDLNNNDDLIEEFVGNWRIYFIETMQPQYLPKGWNISNPVHCDIR